MYGVLSQTVSMFSDVTSLGAAGLMGDVALGAHEPYAARNSLMMPTSGS